jgi:hypothetical protein
MLKFATVGAALAAILSTQVNSNMLTSPENSANQWVQANTSVLADSSSTTPEVTEKLNPAAIMLGLAAVGGGAIGVALSARNAKNPFNSSSALYHSSSKISPKSEENTIRVDQASRKLQKKLLRLLHDDRDTANRLVSQVKMKNPNRSIDWYVDKVIYDLERDRGAY